MKNTQTISDWTTRFTSVGKSHRKSGRIEAPHEVLDQVRTKFAEMDNRIATLQSELTKKQATVSALLANDVRTNEELAELKKLIWTFHLGLPEGCKCNVCAEVERSRTELQGLL